jgi:probable rRNA maturation factor
MPKPSIEIQFASLALETAISTIASAALIKKWVRSAIGCDGLITLRFVNLTEGKELNSHFRNKDKATNVLTFPYELSKNHVVADIIFCWPVIKQEAKEQGKAPKAHLAHLIIHGCLHAQGLDHEHEKEAQKMEAREVALLKSLGFSDPYAHI